MRYHAPVPGNIPSHLRQRGITASVRLKPSPHPFRPSGGRMRHCLGQSGVGPPLSRVSGRDGVLPQCGLAGGHRQRVEELQAGLVDGGGPRDGDAGLVTTARPLALDCCAAKLLSCLRHVIEKKPKCITHLPQGPDCL